MLSNAVIEIIMKRASVRSYTDKMPSNEVIETVVRAGQQAPFAMQLCSTVLQKGGKFAWAAPLNFIILADVHRMQRILEKRGWTLRTNDLTLLLFALQDAAYMVTVAFYCPDVPQLAKNTVFIYISDKFQKPNPF